MPYTTPTSAELKIRFPEFVAVDDARVTSVISEANRYVDNTWIDPDYRPAIMFLAAHMLVMEGVLNPEGVGAQAIQSGPTTSERLGDASVTYANNVKSQASVMESELASTSYGRRFMAIRNVNFRGAITV